MMLARLLSRLDRRRFASVVVSLSGTGPTEARLRAIGIPVVTLNMRRGIPGPALVWQLARAMRRVRPAIVQTWLYHADLLGAVVGRAVGVRTICWNVRCAELNPTDHSRLMSSVRWLLARLSGWPAAVVVNSSAGRRAHESCGYRPDRWELIPNGFDLEAFAPSPERRAVLRSRLGIVDDQLLVGLVARYHPIKDHATFLKAATAVAAARHDVRFLLAGRGIDERNGELMDVLAQYGLRKRTYLCGEVDDTPALFAALDVAVCSSYSEAFPNVIGEAMASGLPCVTTRVGEAPALVGDTGVVVPPRDPRALADAIGRLLSMNAAARRSLGLAARQRIADEYSLDAVVGRYERLYEELSAS